MISSPCTTKKERGGYSAIIYKDGDYTVTEDNVGALISENTNAKTTMQAAIDNGGYIHICGGQYDILGQINLNQMGLSFSGEGIKTILKQTSNYDVMLNVTADNVRISSLKIDGNKANITTSTRNILFSNTNYGSISNCYLIDAKAIAIRGYITNWLSIYNNIIRNTGDRSIYITNTSYYNSIRNNMVENSTMHGIHFETTVQNSEIIGNIVKDCTSFGIGMHTTCNHNLIGNNTVHSCDYDNININNSSYVTIVGNISHDCGESGICTFANSDYCSISGNLCYDNWHYGMNLDSIRYSTITNNICKNNSGVGMNTYAGIGIRHTGSSNYAIQNVITGNYSSGAKQKWGIEMESADDDYNLVIGNQCRGNNLGGVSNPTANSEVAHNPS